MTQAEKVVMRMGGDGTYFHNDAGEYLGDILRSMGATEDRQGNGNVRWTLPDSSVIAEAGGTAWDIGMRFHRCCCWSGAGHTEDCQRKNQEGDAS